MRGLTPDLTAQWWPVGKTSEGEQRRQECGVLTNWQLRQGALRLGHPHRLALAAVDAVPGPQSAVPAGGLQALGAEVARVVRPYERGHHEIAGGDAGHLRADVLHDAEELMAHAAALLGRRHGPVGPQVAPADAGVQHPHQRVGGLLQRRVGHLLHADVAGAVDQGCSHEDSLRWGTSLIVVERAPGLVMLSVMLFAYRRYLVR